MGRRGLVGLFVCSRCQGSRDQIPMEAKIYIKCMFCNFENIKLRLGPTLKKKKKKDMSGFISDTLLIRFPIMLSVYIVCTICVVFSFGLVGKSTVTT